MKMKIQSNTNMRHKYSYISTFIDSLFINEHIFFDQTLFISGNGGDFTLTLGSNIWNYII